MTGPAGKPPKPHARSDDPTLDPQASPRPHPTGRWSRPPEDLSGEKLLRNCPRVDVEGQPRPSLDRYALLSKLGQGGMGVVFHAVHAKLGTEVAIKLLPIALHAQEQGLIDRFEREARLAAQLKSDHLVSVLDIAEDDSTGCHFIVMEYVRGLGADAWLRQHAAKPRVPETEALDVCIAATRGLVSAHMAGVVHRDIKPANILIPCDAGKRPLLDRAKLADLGLARHLAGDASITGTAVAMGTPGYMSPEQATDARRAKKPADVFSMGATLYALLTGNAPFAGSSAADAIVRTAQGKYQPLAEVRADVSRATAVLVARCLDPDPGKRFADAPALLDAMLIVRAALAQGGDVRTRAVSTVELLVNRPERGVPVLTPIPTTQGEPPEGTTATVAPAAPAPPSAAELSSQGTSWTPDSGVVDLVAGVGPRTPLPAPGRPWATWLVGAVAVVALTVATFLLARGREPSEGGGPGAAPAPPPTPGEQCLHVTSEPPGAAVIVDGVERGLTPLTIPDLAIGAHRVAVTLPYHRPFETRQAQVRRGETTALHAPLARGSGRLSIEGAAPGARAKLVRDGAPPREYDFSTDARGALAAVDVEAGAYSVEVTAEGHDSYASRVEVQDAQAATVRPAMAPHDATLSVATSPDGAEVLADGVLVGRSPLRRAKVRPSVRKVTLRLAEHEEVEQAVTVLPGGALDLGEVRMRPWPVLDLTRIGEGVKATVGGAARTGRARVPAGKVEVVLSRDGYADQSLAFDAALGQEIPVRPLPWEDFQARLDLRHLPPDAKATLEGREVSGVVRFAEARDVTVEIVRPGFAPQAVRVRLALGRDAAPQIASWTLLTGTLDLAEFPADARCEIEGKAVSSGAALAPGTYAMRVTREGYDPQDVPVTVRAGEVSRPRAAPWTVAADPVRLLGDLREWDAATSEQRRVVAESVARRDADVTLVRLETFACGGQTHEMAVYSHPRTGLEFVLVPGGTFTMGSPKEEPGRTADETPHSVTLTRPFLVSRTECTQAAYRAVTGANPSKSQSEQLPVEQLSWDEAKSFCDRASLELPTEAQWEWACRAGTTTRWSFGDADAQLGAFAWYDANSGNQTHPVGQKGPNAFGLLDVHGNVWEWCADWYGEYPPGGATDPTGPQTGQSRVLRGGCQSLPGGYARSAFRRRLDPAFRFASLLGVRPVRPVAP